ncbi:Ferredoxin-dependent glutamate synthase 1/mitochondrial [Arachis hypogaea]|nr:Ferredoxin-dependent glutamate synthase 1/mitochondrial [Arachis hypogaea]
MSLFLSPSPSCFFSPSHQLLLLLSPPLASQIYLRLEIVSEEFEGKRLLERHRMVNAALEEEMKEIHALSVKKAVTPEQWKQLQQDSNQANPQIENELLLLEKGALKAGKQTQDERDEEIIALRVKIQNLKDDAAAAAFEQQQEASIFLLFLDFDLCLQRRRKGEFLFHFFILLLIHVDFLWNHVDILVLRELLEFKSDRAPIPVGKVEPASAIVHRFCTCGMSLGAISRETHEAIAIAMNRLECEMIFQGSNYRRKSVKKSVCNLQTKNPSENPSEITDGKTVEKFVGFRKWMENLQRKNPSVTGKNPSVIF